MTRKLDTAWDMVNSLGGVPSAPDASQEERHYDIGYNGAIDDVLKIIGGLGGMDPLLRGPEDGEAFEARDGVIWSKRVDTIDGVRDEFPALLIHDKLGSDDDAKQFVAAQITEILNAGHRAYFSAAKQEEGK